MKIQNSTIALVSTHQESAYAYKESMTIEAAKSKDVAGVILSLSKEAGGKSIKDAMVDYQKQEKEAAKQRQQENEARFLQQTAERLKTSQTGSDFEVSDEYDMKIKMLRRILAALRGEEIPEDCKLKSNKQENVLICVRRSIKNLMVFPLQLMLQK